MKWILNPYTYIAILSIACALLLWRNEILSSDNETLSESLKTANSIIETQDMFTQLQEDHNENLQIEIDRFNADARRVRAQPSRCVPITTDTRAHQDNGQGSEHDQTLGIRSGWGAEYSILAEKYRIERNDCYEYVNSVWNAK